MDEVSYALGEKKKVIPVLSKQCDIPFRLKRLQFVDFTGDYDKGYRELSSALDGGAAPPRRDDRVPPGPSSRRTQQAVIGGAVVVVAAVAGYVVLGRPTPAPAPAPAPVVVAPRASRGAACAGRAAAGAATGRCCSTRPGVRAPAGARAHEAGRLRPPAHRFRAPVHQHPEPFEPFRAGGLLCRRGRVLQREARHQGLHHEGPLELPASLAGGRQPASPDRSTSTGLQATERRCCPTRSATGSAAWNAATASRAWPATNCGCVPSMASC